MRILIILFVLTGLTACSSPRLNTGHASQLVTAQAPLPTGYALNTQPVMQAMHHWDHHAAKVAEGCAKALNHFYPDGGMRVYVAPAGTTSFAKSFRESLLTRLVDYGVSISFTPEGAAILEVNLEYVAHQRSLESAPRGTRRIVEPGFVQAKNGQGEYVPVPVVSEERGFFDTPTPNTEIQINASLIHHGGYLFRDSSIYYVNAHDGTQYDHRAPKGTVELKRYSLVKQ